MLVYLFLEGKNMPDNYDDLLKEFERMLSEPVLWYPEINPWKKCEHEWEQASGWFCGPVTYECKNCGETKDKNE